MVLVRESGVRKPVESLIISDLVYDSWAGKYVEIVDILSRTIELDSAKNEPLFPVCIKQGSIATDRPSRDLLVSPSQVIFYVRCSEKGRSTSPLLEKGVARAIADRQKATVRKGLLKEITYFALFTEEKQSLDVSGVLLSTYNSNIYENNM